MSKVRNVSGVWQKLHVILSKKQKNKYAIMVLVSLLSAILEILGISLLLHTVLSILRPEFVEHNIFTSYLYHALNITDTRTFIMVISFLLFVVYIVKNTVLVQLNKLQVRYAFHITDDVSSRFYKYIANKDLLYFVNKKSSEIIHEIGTISLSFPETILLSSIVLISELMVILLVLGGVLLYKPFLFVFSFLTLFPAAGLLVYINRKRLKKAGARLNSINPQIYENAAELASGIANIKLWNGSDYFYDKYENLKREAYQLKTNIYVSSQYVPMRIYEVIAIAGILCVVLFGVLGDKGLSNIITYISIYAGVSFRLLPSINRIITSSNILSANDYILDLLTKNNIDEVPVELAVSQVNYEHSISLSHVHFAYNDGQEVLTEVNIEIKKGSFVGIIGASGSGKSTLVNILSSLITPSAGSILVDGKKLESRDYPAYRYMFSYVEQDVFMLNDSVLSNVAFLDANPDLDKARQCLEKVNLTAWLDMLPHGWHTTVGEIGNQISGGQRQRIAIARALYKDAEIFIFDEVSNNLDTYSKQQTFAAISELKKQGKTAIFITHKKDELDFCDQVYTVQNLQVHEVD